MGLGGTRATIECLGTVCVARPRCYCCESVLSIPCQIMSRHRTSSRCPQGNGPCHRLSVTLEGFFCFLFLDAHGCRYRLWSKAIWYEFQNNRSPLKGYGSVTIQKLRLTTDKLLSVDGNSVLALQSGWITEISILKSMQFHFEKLQSFSDGQNMSGPISVL